MELNDLKDIKVTVENVIEVEKNLKNALKDVYSKMRDLDKDERAKLGASINEVKILVEEKIAKVKESLNNKQDDAKWIDLSLSKSKLKIGATHPLTKIFNKFIGFYKRQGYSIIEGPDIELDKYNCEMLNMPPHHPARSMQDTFYIEHPRVLLRSHTSAVQVRHMINNNPPFKIVCPGMTYRVDEIDPQHTPNFFQMEGLVVGENITFANLKDAVVRCIHDTFGEDIKARFVPTYYPYTEPSAGIDITCPICKGKCCRTCKNSGWIRIGGSGMIHPNVFKAVSDERKKLYGENDDFYNDNTQGFAFGFGMSRLPQIEYALPELKILHENNIKVFKKIR